ncbi:uncharacterized protein LOC130529906 [Takifugu flavidus]|uniref:Protein SOGA1 SOGA family member 1 n=1 Tax=Takifugu flavidus TaxID=433684 RepID=A0A5C6MSH0_9TELE|nr:uncharacterized protein LOC130529906 [Takifugu flavidus]XP_056896584.1 uncharacterized protein LOC130529906 [Takifugu flavidus]TWW57081.1 Protein SOGA1 SOGA family member 1 [Takifugu flavidus]
MNGSKSLKSVLRSQKQNKAQQPVSVQKKVKNLKNSQSFSFSKDLQSGHGDTGKDTKSGGMQEKRPGKSSSGASSEGPGAQRKLSDASNASEDLSKDSGCLSGKLSPSDSSSEISDCPSEGNKRDSPSSDSELIWIDGGAYVVPGGGGKGNGAPCAKPRRENCAPQPDAAAGGLALFNSSGVIMDLIMGDTTEDLVREVEDLRSENEYLKDEMEELRCEMLEMRDMFQEEEVFQLQELRLQLEQANKTCRILQYRLRKAERRSIRVAQTGQVDGELVRSLEHDIKVAKSVSLRLYNELEVVQKKNSQLEWENEALRERTQELEVTKQVLQADVDKIRESTLKKKAVRSSSKTERRLSQQIEDDSNDLRCQLHFAREELALMCKKLTKLVSESEAMREELSEYRSAYGDIDSARLPEGKPNHTRSREAEVKVHLKLVEEEATLLSRRIVELEVENRGLRAEMSDLRDKMGRCGGEEEEEEGEKVKDAERKGEQVQGEGNADIGTPPRCNQSACHFTREGPVGGERTLIDNPEEDKNKRNLLKGPTGISVGDSEALLALRDHACILTSTIQLLLKPPKNGHCWSPSALPSPSEADLNGKTQKLLLPAPLSDALELLQAMLVTFNGRVETLLRGEDSGKPHDGRSFLSGGGVDPSQGCVEDLRTSEVKERENPTRQTASVHRDSFQSCRDPKMRVSLQILWILHQWCQDKGSKPEEKQGKDQSILALQRLLQDISAELQDKSDFNSASKAAQGKAAEGVISNGGQWKAYSSKGKRLYGRCFPHGCARKNWCYVSREAAQLDQEDPVKTWDHLIMPLSFPDLDFEQMSLERSHTAPEKSALRIYYSPPSARRVQLSPLKQSPVADRESDNTTSPWCTPPTSFSQLCLGSSANLSDDMKEMTVSWRQAVPVPEKRGMVQGQWVGMTSAGTQTHTRPQMVSVGLQTDVPQAPASVRGSPSRAPGASLVSARSHFSTSLEGVQGRADRSRNSTSSPKLYLRNSAYSASSPHLSADLSSSSSSSASGSRERALWNLSTQSHTGLTWSRQTGHRAGEAQANSTKPPSKSAATNRYGMVTEFLRRVSGRVEKTVPAPGQKAKGGLKNLERVPIRSPPATLHRNDSVTRIVNQRFMKQREEVARTQKEEKENSGVRSSPSSRTADDGTYDCSSSSTLTFCFARSSRSNLRQPSNPSKPHRHRYSPPVSAAAEV